MLWPTSPAYQAALEASTRCWKTKVDILTAGEVRETLNVVLDGSVELDDSPVRRVLKVTMMDPTGSLTPTTAHDLLAPVGTEVRPYKGLVLPDGSVEWVPLGVFGVEKPQIASLPGGAVRINLDAPDRVAAVKARRFDAPWVIPAGTKTATAISDIVTSRLPGVPVRITDTGHTTPALVFDALTDPWDAVESLGNSDDLDAGFDHQGALVIAPMGTHDTGITYEPGDASLMVLGSVSRTMDAESTYSGVRVTIEHPDQDPIVVTVWDDDPDSPTYYLGPFGKRPYGFSSPVITTSAQATAVAQAILPRVTKLRQTAGLEILGHPGHDLHDLIQVVDPATKTMGSWTITGASIPLRAGTIKLELEGEAL